MNLNQQWIMLDILPEGLNARHQQRQEPARHRQARALHHSHGKERLGETAPLSESSTSDLWNARPEKTVPVKARLSDYLRTSAKSSRMEPLTLTQCETESLETSCSTSESSRP